MVCGTVAGFGFTSRLAELQSRHRAGKAVCNVREGAVVLPPVPVPQSEALVVALSSEGRLLVFPVAEVPELPRGKGNKLFGIPARRAQAREELMRGVVVLGPGQALRVYSGERQMTLSPADLEHYRGERAQRGAVLPRGWRTVERIEAVAP